MDRAATGDLLDQHGMLSGGLLDSGDGTKLPNSRSRCNANCEGLARAEIAPGVCSIWLASGARASGKLRRCDG